LRSFPSHLPLFLVRLTLSPSPPLSLPTRRSSDLPRSSFSRDRIELPTCNTWHNIHDGFDRCDVCDNRFGTDGSYHFILCGLSQLDRKSTRLNSSHVSISYAVFCLTKKNTSSTNIN